MKVVIQVLVLVTLFGACGDAMAQGPESCEQCVCSEDATCTDNEGNCPNPLSSTACNSRTFNVTCGGQYTLRSEIDCVDDTDCKACLACVSVYQGTTLVATCHTTCTLNDCIETCNVTLTASTQYTLYVCLVNCFEGSCSDCEECVARAYLWKGSFESACDEIEACNDPD